MKHKLDFADAPQVLKLPKLGSPGIVVETVAQASSLHGQDARPTVTDEKRTTLNSGEPQFYEQYLKELG